MANSILTPTKVTREILRVLHEKLSFIGTINMSYDDSFAQKGAKIGDSLKIRLPNKYTVRTGKTLNAQDTSEESVTMTVATQKGVDMNFSSAELTMELDDFSKRIIQPAVAVLASSVEYDALSSMTKNIYNQVGTAGTTPNAMMTFGEARAKLNQYLAPKDNNRNIQIDSIAMASMIDATKGLFQDSKSIAEQYREGMIGRGSGFDWYENERIYVHTNGADVSGITLDSDTLANGDTSCTITGCSTAPTEGTVFTFATGLAVHPETKQSYSHLQQFVVGAGSTTTNLVFSPAIYSSGAKQNVSVMPGTTSALTFVGSASTAYEQHLAYHKDAFGFATADLEMPQGVHFGAREQFEGLSIRVVRQYDINNDNFPCRLDILYGYKTLRPELACRITG